MPKKFPTYRAALAALIIVLIVLLVSIFRVYLSNNISNTRTTATITSPSLQKTSKSTFADFAPIDKRIVKYSIPERSDLPITYENNGFATDISFGNSRDGKICTFNLQPWVSKTKFPGELAKIDLDFIANRNNWIVEKVHSAPDGQEVYHISRENEDNEVFAIFTQCPREIIDPMIQSMRVEMPE